MNLLTPPIVGPPNSDFPIIQYVDDTLVVLKADASQLLCLKALLQTFANSTGLKVNYLKSSMMPINTCNDRLMHFAMTINCQTGCLPFTYLGLPLSITKPSMEHFVPIVQRVERRLCGIADFLNYGGKLQLVKSVLSSLPLFYMSYLEVPIAIKDQIIKYMRYCLWRKKTDDVQAKGQALVSWDKICRPKNQGGLGVLNLRIQNNALLLKNLDKFYNHQDIPWVHLIWETYYKNGKLPGRSMEGSFWWKSHIKLIDNYKGMAKCNLNSGKSAYFWSDLWQDECLMNKFPHLLSYAKFSNISVHDFLHADFLEDNFHLPLSQQAYSEFIVMEERCQEIMHTTQGIPMIIGAIFGGQISLKLKRHTQP